MKITYSLRDRIEITVNRENDRMSPLNVPNLLSSNTLSIGPEIMISHGLDWLKDL